MDILHLNLKEIKELEFLDYMRAINYAWNTYNIRNVELCMIKMFSEDGKDKNSRETEDWSQIGAEIEKEYKGFKSKWDYIRSKENVPQYRGKSKLGFKL